MDMRIVDALCDTRETFTWEEWKEALRNNGLRLVNSIEAPDDEIIGSQAKELFALSGLADDPLAAAIVETCDASAGILSWGEWKEAFKETGFSILSDEAVPFLDEKPLSHDEARDSFFKCRVKRELPEPEPEAEQEIIEAEVVTTNMSVEKWKVEFCRLIRTPPIGKTVLAEDGGPIRFEIELTPGRPPIMFTRVYIPKIVGHRLGWFAQGQGQQDNFGWKLMLLHKSRDEVLRRVGLPTDNIFFVKAVFVLKASESNRALLGEITQW